jgi:hypothetical protein
MGGDEQEFFARLGIIQEGGVAHNAIRRVMFRRQGQK